jgi:hypothetical protein
MPMLFWLPLIFMSAVVELSTPTAHPSRRAQRRPAIDLCVQGNL